MALEEKYETTLIKQVFAECLLIRVIKYNLKTLANICKTPSIACAFNECSESYICNTIDDYGNLIRDEYPDLYNASQELIRIAIEDGYTSDHDIDNLYTLGFLTLCRHDTDRNIKEEFESDMCGIHLNPRMYLKYEYYIGNRMKAIINSFSSIILMPNHLRRRQNVQQQQEDS